MFSPLKWMLVIIVALTPAFAAASVINHVTQGALTFRFVTVASSMTSGRGSDAYLDFGRMSAGRGSDRRGSVVIRRRIAVRLDGPKGAPASARLSVALGEEMPGCKVRLDGKPLSTLPRLIDPVHRVGTAVTHEIEVIIPATVPAGPFLSNLQWVAESF